MHQSRIQSLSQAAALKRIVETVQGSEAGSAPFALILGSGFSDGLVPTARELVEEALPLWIKCRAKTDEYEALKKGPPEDRNSTAQDFWKRFVKENGLSLPLNSDTGLPLDYSAAYRAAFDSQYYGAVGAPAEARRFLRALMRLDVPRLNAAHFLLASLLGVQPGRQRKSELFKAESAFCRLILTTNFDPFLQIALQSVNRLYLISDTPELGVSDEILDDQIDAIHLVYVHGSIHRRSQATTDEEIAQLKEKNARTLKPVLERHGVIVLGYSGWDDAIVEAVAACDRFDHRLYWCGREADPLSKSSYGPRVAEILRKPTAAYIQIESAGHFMGGLCSQLVGGLPRLLSNPIGQLREMLQTIDLSELRPIVTSGPSQPAIQQARTANIRPEIFVAAQAGIISKLIQIENSFTKSTVPEAAKSFRVSKAKARRQARIRKLQSDGEVASALENHLETVDIYTRLLDLLELSDKRTKNALSQRGFAFYSLGKFDEAIRDWTQLIESSTSKTSVHLLSLALINRGVAWGKKEEVERELADYTRVIEQLPGAPVDDVALSLNNRAIAWGRRGETDKELADYNHVIKRLRGAPVDQMALALTNRAALWAEKGEIGKQIADYTSVIKRLQRAPVERVAEALFNRAVTWGEEGDVEKELADYTAVIEHLPGAPAEQVASALINRGVLWGLRVRPIRNWGTTPE